MCVHTQVRPQRSTATTRRITYSSCCRSAKHLEQKCYIETLFHVVHPAKRKNAFSVCEPRIAITAKRSPINSSNLRLKVCAKVCNYANFYVIISSKSLKFKELLEKFVSTMERIKLEIRTNELIKEIFSMLLKIPCFLVSYKKNLSHKSIDLRKIYSKIFHSQYPR